MKAPRERLKYALEAGLLVTALDGLFWSGSQRIAADVLRLRQSGMPVVTTTVEVHDNLTGTTRKIPHTISDTTIRGNIALAAAVRHSLYFIPVPENMC